MPPQNATVSSLVPKAPLPQNTQKVRLAKLLHGPQKVDALASNLKNLQSVKEPLSFTYGAHGMYDVEADVSSAIRNGFALVPGWDGAAFAALGVTTAANAITGSLATIRATQNFSASFKLKDIWASVLHGIQSVGHMGQAVAGAIFFPLRGYTIASLVDAVKHAGQVAPSLMRGGAITGLLGTIFFGLYFVCLSLMALGYVAEGLKFTWDLNHAQDKMQFLEQHTQVKPAQVLEEFKKTHGKQWERRLRELGEAENEKVQGLFQKDGSQTLLPNCEMDLKRVSGQFKVNDWGINEPLSDMQLLGLITELSRQQKVLENKLTRVLGGQGAKDIRKALLAQAPNQQEILEKLNSVQTSALKENGVLLLCFVLGIPVTIMGLMKATVISNIMIAALYALQGVLYLIPDYPAWAGSLQNSAVGKYDKLLLYINMALLVTAMVTAIGVTAAFSFGIGPLVMTLVGGAIWFMLNKRALDKIHRFENLEPDTINSVERLKLYIEKHGVKEVPGILQKQPKLAKHLFTNRDQNFQGVLRTRVDTAIQQDNAKDLLYCIERGHKAKIEQQLRQHPLVYVAGFGETQAAGA